MKATL